MLKCVLELYKYSKRFRFEGQVFLRKNSFKKSTSEGWNFVEKFSLKNPRLKAKGGFKKVWVF